MASFTDTAIWNSGLQLTKDIFESLEGCRMFSFADQLRRSSTSVLANFAEGYSRSTNADKSHKYVIARGECTEMRALLIIAAEVGVIPRDRAKILSEKANTIGRMLTGLIRKYASQP